MLKSICLLVLVCAAHVNFAQTITSAATRTETTVTTHFYFKGDKAEEHCKDVKTDLLKFKGKVKSVATLSEGIQIEVNTLSSFKNDLIEFVYSRNYTVFRIFKLNGIYYAENETGGISKMKPDELDKITPP